MPTVAAALAAADLSGETARLDTELLLCHVLGKPRSFLFAWPEHRLTEREAAGFQQLLERRREGYPVAYLLGRREFWTLDLEVSPATLIPRSATETLVEWALQLDLPANARVVDLGTGTGAIALALASERPGWQVLGCDCSQDALAVARRNAERLSLQRVDWLCSDWYAQLSPQRFDLIVSNPPYIAANDSYLSQGDLRFEPRSALVAAEQGLADLAQLVAGAQAFLAPGGWLLLEHGHTQGAAVRALLSQADFSCVQTRCDLEGYERVGGGQRAVG